MSVRDREDAVVAGLHALAPHLDGEPDPAFRAATRARLVAMAAVRTPAPEPVSPLRRLLAAAPSAPSRLRTRLTAGLAGAALTVTALAALVAVADDALPGNALYGLKRGAEQAQLALAGDARGQTLLGFADTRLEEVRALVDDGATALSAAGLPTGSGAGTLMAAGADPQLVVSTLETMDDHTAEGAAWLAQRSVQREDATPLDELGRWVQEQSTELSALRPDVPAAAEAAVDDSLTLLLDVATRVDGLRSALDCAAGPATLGSDALGPVPSLCLPDQSSPPAPGGAGEPGTTPGGGTTDPPAPGLPSVGGTAPGLPGTGGTGGEPLPTPIDPTVPISPPPLLPDPSLPDPSLSDPSLSVPSLPLPGVGDVCEPSLPITGDC